MKLRLSFRATLALGTAVVVGVTLAGAAALRYWLSDLPPIHKLDNYTPSLVTRLLDVRGDVISELFVEKRSVVPLPEIPLDIQHAFIAIEDTRFYRHAGIDLKGILRATLRNLIAGRSVQGGSTISQQTARNIFLTHERTLSRKIKEVLLTLQMEANLSKDEILQLYLNQIYFGHGAYGLQSAARTFYSKNVSELTLAECALLAGLPRGPRYYSPFNHTDRAIHRRNLVLRRMREVGFITPAEEADAAAAVHVFAQAPPPTFDASYFVEAVRLELEPKFGREMLTKGGLTITTTLDLRMQRAAEAAAAKHLAAFDERYADQRMQLMVKAKKVSEEDYKKWKKWKEDPEKNEAPDIDEPLPAQTALVAVDPRSGGVRALIGGRDFERSQFNRALQAKRQPGSTFKPFVWLAALEAGYTAASVVSDSPIAYTDVATHPKLVAEADDYAQLLEMVKDYYPPDLPKDAPDPIWKPQNWDGKFLGPITLRRGLALSRNLVSVRLIDRVGPQAVIQYARKVGVTSPLDPVLSLALGSSVVTVKEMAGAFGTFANGGVHMNPFTVLKVVDREGNVLLENVPQATGTISPQSNYLMVRLLQAVTAEGTGAYARRLHRPVGGKTGTSQDTRDLWFCGFTPELATAVWIGHDDFTPPGKQVTSAGSTVPLWTEFMQESLKNLPVKDFPVPPGIVFAKIDADTGLLALPSCPRVVLEAFREGHDPKDFCDVDHDAVDAGAEEEITE